VNIIPLTKDSVPVGFNMDATFSNRVHVWADHEIVRIIFGDSVDGDYMRWFGAVAMPRGRAKELAKLLTTLINATE
jgi:hypothetical protein